jgi:cell division protein FtsN
MLMNDSRKGGVMKNTEFQYLKRVWKTPVLSICMAATVMFLTFSFFQSPTVFGGEIYTYKDKDGNMVLSNTPVPEKQRGKAKILDTYKESTPAERKAHQEREEKAKQEQQKIKEQAQQDLKKKEDDLNKAINDCLAAAEDSYANALKADCKKSGQSDNCTLRDSSVEYYKNQLEVLKANCRKKNNR